MKPEEPNPRPSDKTINIDKTALDELINGLPQLAATSVVMAKAMKTMFDAYVNAGFTERQALEIIKVRGLLG